MEKIHLRQAVLVEGKYDAIRLASLVDAVILRCDGFHIFNDREKRALLRRLAERRGLILLTDSDAAGFQIRSYLRSFLPKEQLTQVYIPDIYGKEKRKAAPSKEGKLGVEGMDTKTLLAAFERAGVLQDPAAAPETPLKKLDLYRDGFSGKPGSRERLRALLRALALPERLTANNLAELLCACVSAEEYHAAVQAIHTEGNRAT
ncbi:MAG: DUF4093 domain-containing protein [Oscillospiraceae bacterium]|jgi:ribonuclease M5|nr:DUF4093 domain-containing protein [Oscillospiraceae bacterium]